MGVLWWIHAWGLPSGGNIKEIFQTALWDGPARLIRWSRRTWAGWIEKLSPQGAGSTQAVRCVSEYEAEWGKGEVIPTG